MYFNRNELTKNVFNTIPEWIGLLFGDDIDKGISFTSLMAKGFNKLSEMNKDWWNSYLTNFGAIELIDEQIKSPEYVQFIRQTIQFVAYETREKKREYLLNIAINYHKKHTEISFDEKMLFLNLLDNLSEMELIYVLSWYDKNSGIEIEYNNDKFQELIIYKLVGMGLISQSFDKFNDAFKKFGEQAEKTVEAINEQIESLKSDSPFYRKTNFTDIQKFNPYLDEPEIRYGNSNLGYTFVKFIKKTDKYEEQKLNLRDLSEFF